MIPRIRLYFVSFLLLLEVVRLAYMLEVTLLSTEGATTDLSWEVQNIHNSEGEVNGWEELSVFANEKALRAGRGYQICTPVVQQSTQEIPQSWLLIPGIDINGASRIFVEMNFTMRECSDIKSTCRETFSVYYRVTDSDVSEAFNPESFTKIDTVAAEVRFSSLDREPSIIKDLLNTETVSIKLNEPAQNRVLHIAVVDVGACITLVGVRVYHKVCPRVVEGLAVFPRTMTGVSDTSLVTVLGTCVPNSIYPQAGLLSDNLSSMASDGESTALIGPMYHCTSSGEWQVQTGHCICMAGHQPNRDRTACEPCASGTHKSAMGNEKCSVCPVHSNSATSAAKTCECDAGYHNVDTELVRLTESDELEMSTTSNLFPMSANDCNLCSKLPSAPRDLKIQRNFGKDPGTIQISWNRPIDNGGCHVIKYCVTCEAKPKEASRDPTMSSELQDCRHVSYYPSRCRIDDLRVVAKQLRGHTEYKFTIISYTLITLQRFSQVLDFLSNDVSQRIAESGNQTELLGVQDLTALFKASAAPIVFATNATLPSSVRDINVIFGNQTTISLKWAEPIHPNGKILYYEVKWCLVFEDEENMDPSGSPGRVYTQYSEWQTMFVNNTQVSLTQLYPDSKYDIIISAQNSAGSGNGTRLSGISTLPIDETTNEPTRNDNQPYVIATAVIAVLVVLICVMLVLQWKCRSQKTKHKHPNGSSNHHAEFRPFNSQHEPLDQRTYVDPFSLEAIPVHRFLCETSPDSITCDTVIGCGEFGEVYKGTLATIDPKTGQETTIDVAVKQLRDQCEPQEQINFLREARSLQRFRHQNIVHLEAVVTKTRPFYIVTELMDHGSLYGYLTGLREGASAESGEWLPPLSHVVIAKMLLGVAKGMEYLSGRGFVHRDLAARNVLVNHDLECKVADFGLMRELDSNEGENGGTMNNGNGTYTTRGGKIAIRWTAPEAIAFRTFTQFSDVWSFGILSWEASSFGEKPYWDLTNQEVMKAVNDGFRLPAPDFCPAAFHELMLECWHQDHLSRPNFTNIIARLEQMISASDTYLSPPSSTDSGMGEIYLSDDIIEDDITELGAAEPLLTTVMVDQHNSELTNRLANRFELPNDEEGSEVSSCTSTICASEITVCAANNIIVYVPLGRSDAGSRPESPLVTHHSSLRR